ncbi:MFS transporter like protein [Zymoseptoria brevis]|uniref:MFS transporter like protein n=1 Tax=Zymoseptoria brevis TaxID=1047168 RepID=A0A0F4GU85_9PEZI|nr:MFS transporter like protein [Zymoseptoria brevis]
MRDRMASASSSTALTLPSKASDHQPDDSIRSISSTSSNTEADPDDNDSNPPLSEGEKRLRLKVDLRLCTIAGILCSLNLLDSGIISSASVTSMLSDLDLTGNRYSVSIFIFTISSIAFQLPSTLAVRFFGPRIWFAFITFAFGLITMCTAFIHTWKEMIALRVLLGMAMSGIYPGLPGYIVNFGLNQLDGEGALVNGWRYMYLVQGLITMLLGIITYFWIVPFPENAHEALWFLTADEQKLAVSRIQKDRKDVQAEPFTWREMFHHAKDVKVYGFACMFFLLNLVSTSLSYFLPIILQSGMGFSENESILLSAPPYYYAVLPVILSSVVGDKFNLRGPIIVFNCICLIIGFCMLGFTDQVTVRYIGTYLATGSYVSNWAAITTYQANNITGQWKRAFTAAAVTAMNGAGGIAGSYIVRQEEAPRYMTAVWISIGSHILIIAFVGVFSLYFYAMNKRQRAGKALLEGTVGFRYTF